MSFPVDVLAPLAQMKDRFCACAVRAGSEESLVKAGVADYDAALLKIEAVYEERDAFAELVAACRHEHGGKRHEPECPICIALEKFPEA